MSTITATTPTDHSENGSNEANNSCKEHGNSDKYNNITNSIIYIGERWPTDQFAEEEFFAVLKKCCPEVKVEDVPFWPAGSSGRFRNVQLFFHKRRRRRCGSLTFCSPFCFEKKKKACCRSIWTRTTTRTSYTAILTTGYFVFYYHY